MTSVSRTLCCSWFLAATLAAQGESVQGEALQREAAKQQKEYEARFEKKRTSLFLKTADWSTDYDAALAAAGAKKQLLLIYFTRSYAASPPCEALENKVLSSLEFRAMARSFVLCCHITSRVEGHKHQGLLRKLGGQTFPHLLVVDSEARRIASLSGGCTLESVRRLIEVEAAGYTKLRDLAKKGAKKDKAAYFLKRLSLGHLTPKIVEQELAAADYLSERDRVLVNRGLANLQVLEVISRIDAADVKSMQVAAERLLEMKEKGRIPSGRNGFTFWQVLLAHADAKRDAKLFGEALESIKKLPIRARPDGWLRRMEARLSELRHARKKSKRDG